MGHATGNFIVDFGGAPTEGGSAWCAVDIDHSEQTVKAVKELLKKPVLLQFPAQLLERDIHVLTLGGCCVMTETDNTTDKMDVCAHDPSCFS